MLLSDIKHKTTLNAIKKHNITDEQLLEMKDTKDLRLYIRRASRRLWQQKNKKYFQDYYYENYDSIASSKYYFNLLPNV